MILRNFIIASLLIITGNVIGMLSVAMAVNPNMPASEFAIRSWLIAALGLTTFIAGLVMLSIPKENQ